MLLSPLLAPALVSCGGSSPSFCELATEFQRADLSAEGDLKARMTEALEVLDDLIDAAPREIADEARTLRDGVEAFVTRGDPPGPRFAAASEELTEYIARECGRSEPT